MILACFYECDCKSQKLLKSKIPSLYISKCTYAYVLVKLLQSCLTLCDPMVCSPSGSSVHGILQTRILVRVAISSSRGSSQPRDWTQVSWVSYTITLKFLHMHGSFPCNASKRLIHSEFFQLIWKEEYWKYIWSQGYVHFQGGKYGS